MLKVSVGVSSSEVAQAYEWLTQTYWAKGMPRDVFDRAVQNSMCFKVTRQGVMVAFGRVVTDRATYGYLTDIFVPESERGNGLASMMVEAMHAHPELQGFRRWALMTLDAQELYAKQGYKHLPHPERYMEIHDTEVYKR